MQDSIHQSGQDSVEPLSHWRNAPVALKPPTLEPSAWLRAGISRSHAYDLMAANAFPRPVRVGRASRFVTAEIDAWIAARVAERDAAQRATRTGITRSRAEAEV